MKMNVQVGASTFTATLEDNAAVDALGGDDGKWAGDHPDERLCRI